MQSEKTNRILIVSLLVAGIVLSTFFGTRVIRPFLRGLVHPHPILTDVNAIGSWMTIPYISRVYNVPQDLLFQQLGIPQTGKGRNNLDTLNRLYFNNQPGVLLGKIKTIVSQYQQTHPTPLPQPAK